MGTLCTSKVTDMYTLFYKDEVIGDISKWNVSHVTNMSYIGTWNVSNVTNMSYMFSTTNFNQDISKWNTISLIDIRYMFAYNPEFNQDLSNWNKSSISSSKVVDYSRDTFSWKDEYKIF